MRGTQFAAHRGGDVARFIPAHAGNTDRPPARSRRIPVHPRACGEHLCHDSFRGCFCGSSPRMRGTRCVRSVCRRRTPVHPRACGEHNKLSSSSSGGIGSSPRMRGTRAHAVLDGLRARFIPAHAGNTGSCCWPCCASPVHPRACGEHIPTGLTNWILGGSSPRMRGTQGVLRRAARKGRFIPAHAGNTRRPGGRPRTRPVHPRACGEHKCAAGYRNRENGSSPRMRGTQLLVVRSQVAHRFIPAHAGNTGVPAIDYVRWAVHPRACGEHGRPFVEHHQDARFIPAHAGNTVHSRILSGMDSVHPRACGEHL